MRILISTFLIALAGAGCSSAPSDSPPASGAQPQAAAVAKQPASEAGSGKEEFKPPPGYRTKIDGWNIVYCRKTPVLGSRFPKEICMTEQQLKDHIAANETFGRDKDQVSRVCSQQAGCANP